MAGVWRLGSGTGDPERAWLATTQASIRTMRCSVGCNLDGDWAETGEWPIKEAEVVWRLL